MTDPTHPEIPDSPQVLEVDKEACNKIHEEFLDAEMAGIALGHRHSDSCSVCVLLARLREQGQPRRPRRSPLRSPCWDRLTAALELLRVERAKHVNVQQRPTDTPECRECGYNWPCPSFRAMDKVLEG